MDEREAKAVLDEQLSRYRNMSHAELRSLIDNPSAFGVCGPSGTLYGVEIEVFWDRERGKDLRVIGSIDDGGARFTKPLSEDFIMREDGAFVGE